MMDGTTCNAEAEHLLEEEKGTYRQRIAQTKRCNSFGNFIYWVLGLSILFNFLQAIVYRDVSVKVEIQAAERLSKFGESTKTAADFL